MRRYSPGETATADITLEESGTTGKLLSAERPEGPHRRVRRLLQHLALPRETRQSDPGGCVHRSRSDGPGSKEEDQAENDRGAAPTILPAESRLTINLMSRNSLFNQAA